MLRAGVKTLITAMGDPAVSGKLCSLDMAIPPHLDNVIRGKKKRNSNFNCGHFKNIISSYICILVPRSDNAGTDGCTVTIASMLHTLLGQTIPEEPAPEAFPQHSTHFYICSEIHTCTHTDFLNADSSPLPCAAYSIVLSI